MAKMGSEDKRIFGKKPSGGAVGFVELYKPYRRKLALGLLLLLLTNMISLWLPRFINGAVSKLEGNDVVPWPFGSPMFSSFWLIPVVLVVLASISAVLRTYSRSVVFNIGRGIERDLRSRIYGHLLTLSGPYFKKASVGGLLSHLVNDLTSIRAALGFGVLNFLNLIIIFAGSLPFLFSMDLPLAVAVLLPIPLVIGAAQFIARRMFGQVKDAQAALSSLTGHVQENLSGIQVVRLYHQEKAESERFRKTNEHAYQKGLKLAFTRSIMFPVMRTFASLSAFMALLVGGLAVIAGKISLGDYVEVNTRLLQLSWPAMSLGFITAMYQRGKACLERVNVLLEQRPEFVDGDQAPKSKGAVLKINALSVSKPEASSLLLENISLELKKGNSLGICGLSGSGKSVLLQTICRQLPIQNGELKLWGQNIWDLPLSTLHQKMAVVDQEPFLFSQPIWKNLSLSEEKLPADKLNPVLEALSLDKDFARFEKGLDTFVGERGITLSGGQRQRIALARAILRNPDLLVLDDCLSAVDIQTEAKILKFLKASSSDLSMVMVSHRPSALALCDEIIVMEQGKIVDRGTHRALMAREGLYRLLFERESLLNSLEKEGLHV